MFLDVLQAQESLFQAQRNLADSKAQLSTDLIILYKALGGGWQNQASVADDIDIKPQRELWLDGVFTAPKHNAP
jgi:hypothetical protein